MSEKNYDGNIYSERENTSDSTAKKGIEVIDSTTFVPPANQLIAGVIISSGQLQINSAVQGAVRSKTLRDAGLMNDITVSVTLEKGAYTLNLKGLDCEAIAGVCVFNYG